VVVRPIGGTVGIERLLPNGAKPGRMVPLARMGDSGETTLVCNVDQADEDEEDIANAAVFLFSPAANWVTGNVMVVDGGSNHVSQVMLPYPEALLDPDSVKDLIKAKPKL
jgi:peroxisomal 2,4-dienoyl-CoA reductase